MHPSILEMLGWNPQQAQKALQMQPVIKSLVPRSDRARNVTGGLWLGAPDSQRVDKRGIAGHFWAYSMSQSSRNQFHWLAFQVPSGQRLRRHGASAVACAVAVLVDAAEPLSSQWKQSCFRFENRYSGLFQKDHAHWVSGPACASFRCAKLGSLGCKATA